MKKFLLSCLTMMWLGGAAQTVLISPTVKNGGFEDAVNSDWTIINGTQTNKWQLSTGADAGFSGTKSAYISSSSAAPFTQNYDIASTSVVHM